MHSAGAAVSSWESLAVSSESSGFEGLLTARLSLRRPTPGDIAAILAIVGDPRASAHNPSDLLTSFAEAEGLYQFWDRQWRTTGLGYLVVRRRAGEETVGFCGVKIVRFRDADALNLYYRLAPSAWGEGIASEAAAAVITWAESKKPELPIIARVSTENLASQRVATKIGLHRAPHLDQTGPDGPELIFTSA